LWELCTQALPIGPKYSFNLGHLLSDSGGGGSVIYQNDKPNNVHHPTSENKHSLKVWPHACENHTKLV